MPPPYPGSRSDGLGDFAGLFGRIQGPDESQAEIKSRPGASGGDELSVDHDLLVGQNCRQLARDGKVGGVPFTGQHSGLMEDGPLGALDGLQVGAAAVSSLGENAVQQLIYLPRNFLMECSSRFFSWPVQPPGCCSTGRRAQIFSLMPTRSSPSFWNRWNSATSGCALRSAAGLGYDSVTLLPATLRVRRN